MHAMQVAWRRASTDAGLIAWIANPRTFRYTRVSAPRGALLGFSRRDWCQAGFWESRIVEADRAAVAEFFGSIGRSESRMACEYRVCDATNQVRWIRTIASLTTAARHASLAGAHRDVTTEQLALDGLADAERRYDLVTRLGRVSLWQYRKNGWLGSDDVLPKMLGMDATVMRTSEDWIDRIHPDDRSRVLEQSERMLASAAAAAGDYLNASRTEFRVRGDTGEWRWLTRSEAVVEGSGADARIAAVVADITPEVEERDAHRRLEQLYRGVWASIPGCAVALDAEGRIIDANDAWREAARTGGAPREAFVGESYLDATRRAAERGEISASNALDGISRLLSGECDSFSLEYQSHVQPQAVRWFRLSAFSLKPPASGAIVVHWDITERKSSDLAIQGARDQLADMQRLATMSELATSIAHELNQPLAAIMAAGSTLRRQLRADERIVVQATIDDIIESTARAAEVMRRARAMIRRDNRLHESLTLDEIVSAVTRLLASDVVIHQVTMTVDVGPDVPRIVGDRIQLQQVLLNLLLNAIDAVRDRPIAERKIRIAAARSAGDRVELVVSDSGRGIAPDMVDRVFDLFATTKPDGAGLGLAIVRAIVESHGGRVVAESIAEGGAAFRVSLPC